MKAALKTADGRFTIEDVEEPALPADNWVKARIRVAGEPAPLVETRRASPLLHHGS